jgi:hypothetical protein
LQTPPRERARGSERNGARDHPAAVGSRLSPRPAARANWAIFLDHIPNNPVNWITQRNYGFSDAADLFIFISGYTASFVYARMMLERGFVVGGVRLIKPAWQIYVAHIILFVMHIAEIAQIQVSRSGVWADELGVSIG